MKGFENLIPPKKGEIRNPNGRPKKLLTELTAELLDLGYEKVKPSQIQEVYELLLGLTQDEIEEKCKDKRTPMIVRIVGASMLGKNGFEIIEKMLDRVHGRIATRNENVNLNINANEINENYTKEQMLSKVKDFERILSKE